MKGHCPFIVIALGDLYNNYRKFVKLDSVAREVVPLTHSGPPLIDSWEDKENKGVKLC